MPDAPSVNDSQPEATPAATPDADLQGEPTVTVQNGRRRGRRRVIKKKKVKDDEGYLGESRLYDCKPTC
jgi:DNA polymerase delta subunit 3